MKIGIVGCGGVANVHATALNHIFENNKDYSLYLCDIVKEHSDNFLKKYNAKATFNSLDEMLDSVDLDCLHICTPHFLHVPMAVKALNKNINVIMEKPPAITFQQLHTLEEAEKNSSARLGICFQNRYNLSTLMMKDAIQSKKYGEITGARAFVTWSRGGAYYTDSPWRGSWDTEGGGVLTNQTIHTLDLLNQFLGKPISVEGHIANHHLKGTIEVEDTAEAFIQYEKCNACYYASTAYSTNSAVFIEISMENMTVRLEGEEFSYIKDGKVVDRVNIQDENAVANVAMLAKMGKGYWGNSHEKLISDYYDKLNKNQPFAVTLDSCKDTIKLVWGIYNSSKVGTEMKI